MAKRKVKKKWQGLHADRYSREPAEMKMALAWQEFNEPTDHLPYLLDKAGTMHPEPVSDRDRLVANTVIQWLGSPVGSDWVKTQFKRIGL